jgi:hypothetical protein
MGEDDRRGVGFQDHPGDLARGHRGTVDGASEERLHSDQPMPGVEQQKSEDFVRQGTDLVSQVLAGEIRTFEDRGSAPKALGDERCCPSEELVR